MKKRVSAKTPSQTWESFLNVVRGKNLVGKANKEDILAVFEYVDLLERHLDQADAQDTFGTEGWRRFMLDEDGDE